MMTGIPSTATRGPAEVIRRKPLRLVLGLAPSPLAESVAAQFQALGWDVTLATTGFEAGWLAHRARPAALVIGTELPGETGFLTCAKVRLTRPACRVVLVGPACESAVRRARYAGAVCYLPDTTDAAEIIQAVLGT